jgi:hypothetical protein
VNFVRVVPIEVPTFFDSLDSWRRSSFRCSTRSGFLVRSRASLHLAESLLATNGAPDWLV